MHPLTPAAAATQKPLLTTWHPSPERVETSETIPHIWTRVTKAYCTTGEAAAGPACPCRATTSTTEQGRLFPYSPVTGAAGKGAQPAQHVRRVLHPHSRQKVPQIRTAMPHALAGTSCTEATPVPRPRLTPLSPHHSLRGHVSNHTIPVHDFQRQGI